MMMKTLSVLNESKTQMEELNLNIAQNETNFCANQTYKEKFRNVIQTLSELIRSSNVFELVFSDSKRNIFFITLLEILQFF